MSVPAPKRPAVAQSYDSYHAWKGWAVPFTYDAEQAGYFAGELGAILKGQRDVLEIGFGSGACLAWMRDRGFRIAGSEVSAQSAGHAQAAGVPLLGPDLPADAARHVGAFDVVIALDVFEHLSLDEVAAYLDAVHLMLRPQGKLLLRFPNGQSPFGLYPQNGDPTHRSILSRSVIESLVADGSFTVSRYAPAFKFGGTQWRKRLLRSLRFALQRMIGRSLNLIYGTDIPYDPVVVVELRKTDLRISASAAGRYP